MSRPTHDPRFDLEPPSRAVFVWFFVLAVVLPVATTTLALAVAMASSDTPMRLVAGSVPLTWATIVPGMAALTLSIWWLLHRRLRRHSLAIRADGIDIVTTFYRRVLAIEELDLANARVADLGERTELKPMLKTNGTGLPGFRSGWFRLRNRNKAFVAMTTGPRVLWIPTRRGDGLLLQPRQPQPLLDHLRAMAGARDRR